MDYITIEKLKWHSRRSILELDLYFSRFLANDGLNKLSEDELYAYQELLDYDDQDLLLLFLGKCGAHDLHIQAIVNKVCNTND